MRDAKITHFVWTDIGKEDEDAFNAWYSDEHVPDRILKIPGFLRGRRFAALSGAPRYLAYYEMANREVFWRNEYVQMRGNPDEKSRYFVQRFRNALRSTATIECEADRGEGEILAIAGITRPGDEGPSAAPFGEPALAPIVGGDVSRIRLSRSDWDLVNANFKKMDGLSRGSLRPPDKVPAFMLTVEGSDAGAVAAALDALTPSFGDTASVEARAVMRLISAVSAPAR